jgi:hypothetical protein
MTGAKLDQSKLIQSPFDGKSEHILVESDRTFDVGDAKNHMVEADRCNRIIRHQEANLMSSRE